MQTSIRLSLYIYNGSARVRGRQDNPEHNLPLIIRDEAMNNFINLTQ